MTGETMVKERPILFSGPMVRALLDGRKTQTRRAVKFPHANPLGEWRPVVIGGPDGGTTASGERIPLQGAIYHDRAGTLVACPYGAPGDRLWVRETWRLAQWDAPIYRADAAASMGMDEYSTRHKWKPSIHMPRQASRLTLEITAVRVERVQDISGEDVLAEGVGPVFPADPTVCYAELWDSLNKARCYGWDANPWVFVIEFRRLTTEEAR